MVEFASLSNTLTGVRLETAINQERLVRDVAEQILLLDPNEYPLVVISSKLRKRSCKQTKFEWQEDKFTKPYMTYKSGDDSSGGDFSDETSLTVDTDEYIPYQKWDAFLNMNSGEIIYLTETPTSETINNIVRGAFGTTPAYMTADDKLWYIGNVVEEAAGAPVAIHTKITMPYNYVTKLKTAVEMSGDMLADETYGGPDWEYFRRKKGVEHARKIERLFWWGQRGIDTSIQNSAHMSRGVMHWLSADNIISNSSGAYTAQQLFEDMETIGRYGAGMRTAFCAPRALTTISGWGLDDLQTIPSDETYGINIKRLVTPHLDLNLVKTKMFQDMGGQSHPTWGNPNTLMVLLQMDKLAYVFKRGRDTHYIANIQLKEDDLQKDQYFSQVGIQFEQPEIHGAIDGVTTS